MFEADYEVVGVVIAAGASTKETHGPGAGPTGEPRPCQDGNRPFVLQPDPPRIEWCNDCRSGKIENAARFEKELPFLREEVRKTCQVDDLAVRFDLGEVGIDGEVRGESRRDGQLGVDPRLGIAVAGLDHTVSARPGDDAFRGGRLSEQVRPELEISSTVHLAEPGQGTGLDQIIESL